ncbi:fungal specific transcription factor domain-containing protein [Trichoderma breve]|uniref:Fungal specific transcription factor domain-containing protein n=1 Tax=Trichoderma breve TaxID=2034170 RepID=A0A9W9E9J5_9HYPO|nr:fungal specific transcription factor domain-containing protein [Trichoderma breve]KAJ4859866.1 fungal specific transcription factor domain-containing protein [Trichoderma breve]
MLWRLYKTEPGRGHILSFWCLSLNSQLLQECEWPAVKRIAKTADGTARTLSPLVGTVDVPEEQGLSSGETSHPGCSVPRPSPDSISTSTLHPGWSHTRADDAPQDLFGGNLFPPQFNPIDDVSDKVLLRNRIMLRLTSQAILQLWAETCAPFLSDDASEAVSSGRRPSSLPLPATITMSKSVPDSSDTISSMPGDSSSTLPDGTTQAQILQYFRDRLASLLSYDQTLFPNAFHAFNATASANIGNSAGRALHYGILALASRHMFNKGQLCYERISEQLGVEGSAIILQRLKDIPKVEEITEEESITLLAGLLMFVMYKICRGDVWGFESYFTQLKRLCAAIFTLAQAPKGLSNTKFSFLENVIYHDSYGCSLYAQGPAIDPEVSTAYANTQRGIPHSLTGLALPLYCILPRIAKLVNQSWAQRNAIWTDQELAEIVSKAENLEATLEKERIWLENFVRDRPDMASHRYFHDGFRIACLLQIKCFVLCLSPDALSVRLLVRNALSLLETMEVLNLPGFVSSHWIIFTVSICSTSSNDNHPDNIHTGRGGSSESNVSDRERASKLYATAIDKLAFLNMSRSRQIVQKLWDQNQGGRLSIHWLSILADFDWEIIFA